MARLWGRCPLRSKSQTAGFFSLLQQPGPKKFKLSQIELIYKAKKFKVPKLDSECSSVLGTLYLYYLGMWPSEETLYKTTYEAPAGNP